MSEPALVEVRDVSKRFVKTLDLAARIARRLGADVREEVESADTDRIFGEPSHPYTRALLQEVPRLEARKTAYRPIEGEISSPLDPPDGCHFHPRCPHASARCRQEAPALREIAPGWHSACHLNEG